MNEKSAQDSLIRRLRGKSHQWVAPNVTIWRWESDLVSITRRGLLHEFEIKVGRQDFLHEMRIANGSATGPCKWIRHSQMNQGKNCANYFWFAAPDGVVKDSEIPDHAGFIRLSSTESPTVMKEAPRLHGDKASIEQKEIIAQSLVWRYWDLRLKLRGRSLFD